MTTLNDILHSGGSGGGVGASTAWSGTGISTEEVTSDNADASAEQCTVPAGTRSIVISIRSNEAFAVWIVPAGATTPTKNTPTIGAIIHDTTTRGRVYAFDVDPADLPDVYVGERVGTSRTFDVIYLS